MKRILLPALLVLTATSCASNVERSNDATAQLAPAEPEPVVAVIPEAADDDVICRRQIVSGSHFQRRVCTTREQRTAMQAAADELLTDIARETAIGRNSGAE